MTTIYLDTNILLNESYFRSHFSNAFLKACSLLKVNVVIPEIVLDEVLGNYPITLKAKLKNLQKYQKELSRLVDLDEIEISPEESFSEYEDFLYTLIETYGIHVAPYPEISPKDLVLKSYEKEKPFKDSGEGHKDFLVWETVKLHLATDETAAPNIILTNNTKDFGVQDQDKKYSLHPHLSEQIENPEQRPILITALRDAWDSHLAPKLEGMTAKDIPNLSDEEIREVTSGFLLDDLPDHTSFGFEGLPFSNDVSISMVGPDEISEITCAKVGEEVIVKVVGSVEIEATGFIEKHAYYSSLEDSSLAGVSVLESDWNDHVMLVGAIIDTAFELSIFYSLKDSKIVGHEVSLPQEIESDWYN